MAILVLAGLALTAFPRSVNICSINWTITLYVRSIDIGSTRSMVALQHWHLILI